MNFKIESNETSTAFHCDSESLRQVKLHATKMYKGGTKHQTI